MKKPTLALFFILMSLLIVAPKLWAQPSTCVEANDLLWCFNDQACGQPCNEVCAALGTEPISDNDVWFEAQNTLEKCQAISQAFGLGNTVTLSGLGFACLQDQQADHTAGGLIPPLLCSTLDSCPAAHRTGTGNPPIPCNEFNSIRSICPCQPIVFTPIPTLSEWGLIAVAVVLGIVGFMVIRRRKVTA